MEYLSVLGSPAFQEVTPHRFRLSVLEHLLFLGYPVLRDYLDVCFVSMRDASIIYCMVT